MPRSDSKDSLQNEPNISRLLTSRLKPDNNDIIIIGSDNQNLRIAEFAAKKCCHFYYNES